ncbi:unnamed protein product [Bemisia tabaci]|uniref:U1-type domain-containing protein n=1 Tax=Bemisia tabaci TaxID=7038 RepID=A0A9P0ADP4_BEMTA|nr:unnamed protein product [Bemisia tabaci]
MGDPHPMLQIKERVVTNHLRVPVDSPGEKNGFWKPLPSGKSLDLKMDEQLRMSKRTKPGSRVRSASTGRDKKSELQARYWAFLFGNLQRAVDEIYQTCESDESISECKEVILVLENFTREFHSLVEWFKLKWEYENTAPPQRPTSLAWEVRKSSPRKFQVPKMLPGMSNSFIKKKLSFNSSGLLKTIHPNDTILESHGLKFGDVDPENCLSKVSDVVSENSLKRSEDQKSPTPLTGSNDSVNDKGFKSSLECDQAENKISSKVMKKTDDSSPLELSCIQEVLETNNSTDSVKDAKPLKSPTVKKVIPSFSVKNASTASKITATAKKPLAAVKSNPTVIPGRNVAAAAFVPKKTIALSNQTVNNCTKPTTNATKISPSYSNPKALPVAQRTFTSSKSLTVPNLSTKASSSTTSSKTESVTTGGQKSLKTTTSSSSQKTEVESGTKVNELEKESASPVKASLNVETKSQVVLKDAKKPAPDVKILVKDNAAGTQPIAQQKDTKKMTDVQIQTDEKSVLATKPKLVEKTEDPIKVSRAAIKLGEEAISKPVSRPEEIPQENSKSCPSPKVEVNPSVDSSKKHPANSSPDPTYTSKVNTPKILSQGKESLKTVSNPPAKSVSTKPAYSSLVRSRTSVEIRPSKHVLSHRNSIPSNTSNKQIISPLDKALGRNFLKQSKNIDIKSCYKSEAVPKKTPSSAQKSPKLRKTPEKDPDGWETVVGRSRRSNPLTQSSSSLKLRNSVTNCEPSNRYYLPSPATSLPALALSMEKESKDVEKNNKQQKNKENWEIAKMNQRNKLKSVKNAEMEKDRPIMSHLGAARQSAVKTKQKDLKVQDGKKKDGESEKRKVLSKENEKSKGGKRIIDHSKTELLEDELLDKEEIRKSKELDEEEKNLQKEIQVLESTEIEIDTETDEVETDWESSSELAKDDADLLTDKDLLDERYRSMLMGMPWADQMEALDKLETLMAMDTSSTGLSWGERMKTLEQLEEIVARSPGRALELHQKLSSPSRRRTIPDAINRHQARQARAQKKRQELLQKKSSKLRWLLNKVEEVKSAQNQLAEERRCRIELKLKKAEENRNQHLSCIRRKAHDEEEKLKEIAFINELEAQNKRHDFLALCQEQEERLQGIIEERQRKLEEKAAKEAAVEERKKALEAERQEKLEKMQERRRIREERIHQEQQEKEKERQELAREKAKDREDRLLALQAAQLANVEELQKKIQQKQEESARRHEENIELIRQRALEFGMQRSVGDDIAPQLVPYEKKKYCTVCKVLIDSEVFLLSHLRGKPHLDAVKKVQKGGECDENSFIIVAPDEITEANNRQTQEKLKAVRKRCKKIKAKLNSRGEEYLAKLKSESVSKKTDSPNKSRLSKCVKDIGKLVSTQGVGLWPDNAITLLERNLNELCRIFDKKESADQSIFRELQGFTCLSNLLDLAICVPKSMFSFLPLKCFVTIATTYLYACQNSIENSKFVLLSNKIALLLDVLYNRLNILIPDSFSDKPSPVLEVPPVDNIAGSLMKLVSTIISQPVNDETIDSDVTSRIPDVVSYIVSVGITDKLTGYCGTVRNPIDDLPDVAQFLLSLIQFLSTLAETRCPENGTRLLEKLKDTELMGAVSLLYGMLLHQGAPQTLPSHTLTVATATMKFLATCAQLQLKLFQSVLGAEGISLQFRHIASYLLWYCSQNKNETELLHQVVELVGYFAVGNNDNQLMLQTGHMPTVLQQLCNLPFPYFSNPNLTRLLFPVLLACIHDCPENRAVFDQELSYQLLEEFQKSEEAKSLPLIQILEKVK